ncbi:MAG: hypothetical protein CVU57_00015 [Deltaproteobacteria bacterium HGW-Deltaproteobacteria-15]|jgi:hypothetical protein|nr:MAG: hypothetical protein CVU57_00015 [Deltaproteobacteria bacterium HGW-Deltaproteobacteria-15]
MRGRRRKAEYMQPKGFLELGEGVKETREELFHVLRLTKGLPKKITNHLSKAIDSFDLFRSHAEELMFKLYAGDQRLGPDDLHIFRRPGWTARGKNEES